MTRWVGVAGKLAVVIAIWHYDSLSLSPRPAAGIQVISAKRGGSCCIKFLVACTKVRYTFAPAYINYTPGQSQIAKCSKNNNRTK